ncbi:uncharacterized protein LOC115323732 [Ixodes scapularis]|uniref:uncharacterized protein LOC115323732 n=1 Tax=Ixodes scapularis TaxID=6945 RepID=UPI001A9DE78D|nr:uncharacterized protein LOC115323732 [Ixodes scapularis]
MNAKVLVFVFALLSVALMAEAQRFPGGGGGFPGRFPGGGGGGARCGRRVCPRGTICRSQVVQCFRAPCPPIRTCVRF